MLASRACKSNSSRLVICLENEQYLLYENILRSGQNLQYLTHVHVSLLLGHYHLGQGKVPARCDASCEATLGVKLMPASSSSLR